MNGSEKSTHPMTFTRTALVIAGEKGFTLSEILVALALTGIVACAIYQSMATQQEIYIAQDHANEMMQNLRGTAQVMMRDIRTSGYDPRQTAGAGFDLGTSASLQFKTDSNGDGDFVAASSSATKDSNEQIMYALTNDADSDGIADAFPCGLGRAVWGGGLQLVSEDIEVLNFVYLDKSGAVLPTPISAADLPEIRAVEITLVGRTEKQDKGYKNNAQFKNQRGALIFSAPDDGYRRESLSFTVQCRNMGL